MFDSDRRDQLPPDIDRYEPGPALAAFLSSVRMNRLSGHQRVVALKAFQRMAAHYAAQTYEAIASISDLMHEELEDAELAHRSTAAEVRTALGLTRRGADLQVERALETRRRLPAVWQALLLGRIDDYKARVIANSTIHLTEQAARRVVDQIINDASHLTTGQLRARLGKLCMQVDPEEAEQRYTEAVRDRRVFLQANPSGTAELAGSDLPPDRAVAISRRINQLARKLKTHQETRTIDQLRADVFLDLLEGGNLTSGGDRGVVHLQVDLTTLTGLEETAGELNGFGPVVSDIARQITERQHGSEWRWTVTHPDTGLPIFDGTTRRRPLTHQRRRVESRDSTCIFPGCRMPATDCDLDHRTPWESGGSTSPDNLAPLCRHDHTNRHQLNWQYQPLGNGDYLWTSPLGHQYTTSGRPP